MTQSEKRQHIKMALPKGDLLKPTSSFLHAACLGFHEYGQDSRLYHLKSSKYKNISAKIFQEKDIPVQVAVGNYDIGICGLDWIEELLAKYPESPIIKLTDLEYDTSQIYLASSRYGQIKNINMLLSQKYAWRIVSEYPNLSENTVINLRLPRFKIFPVCGAAETYLPENAELTVIEAVSSAELKKRGLVPLKQVMQSSVFVIVNKKSWQTKNIGTIIKSLNNALGKATKPWLIKRKKAAGYAEARFNKGEDDSIRLALPDGHQLVPTSNYIQQSRLKLDGYSNNYLHSRPSSNIAWLRVKVIRPQDMPMQTANENFDLAITGKDWLLDHVCRFPSSPVIKLLDLKFGIVSIVAVMHEYLPIKDIEGLKQWIRCGNIKSLRVASEYINIADYYMQNNHMQNYVIIPSWGATEALIPEDADMLIENTQTGKTLAAHKLKIIDTLFQSTACLICNKNTLKQQNKRDRVMEMVNIFKNIKGI